ncbi:hypothetical protein AWJ20_1462 [Sugiyamaella lignohabitans]|uniref:Spindle assembly checkpoint component MAD1 n=1 Tax=Sugiyamaella lignohabitans TaxID=796027 RepID=A0A167DQS8_9ASCO|nr:uncharacterized protein AWJ20_1462 [Sugiyamaella lignohabitans]ANB13180.1 hypothetical protein AWJ20_1462 [Sugiyamaella lignohabitans]
MENLEIKNRNLEISFAKVEEELDRTQSELFAKQQTIIENEETIMKLKNELAARGRKRSGAADGNDNNEEPDMEFTTDLFKRELNEQFSNVRSLESQIDAKNRYIERLEKDKRIVDIVEQEKEALETKLKLMSDLQRHNTEMELQIIDLQQEKNKWLTFLEKDDRFSSPQDVVRELMNIRIEKTTLLSKIGQLEESLSSTTSQELEVSQDLQKLKDQVTDYHERLDKESQQRIRYQRQADIISKEAQMLRDQLKAYEAESVALENKSADIEKDNKITELETLVERYKQELKGLNDELVRKEGLVVQLNSPLRNKKRAAPDSEGSDSKLAEQLSSTVRKNRSLQNDLDKSEQKVAQLSHEINALQKQIASASESQQAKHRILELRDNPTSRHEAVKVSTLKALQKENDDLHAQLSNSGNQANLVPKSALDRIRDESKQLERTIQEQNKRMDRIKEVFAKKSLEFREAVYSLLGYRVDLLPNRKIRATSMFTTSDTDSFTFIPDPKAKNKFIGIENSPWAAEFENLITFWIKERQDIPCFLSALNLELYDRTTKAARF